MVRGGGASPSCFFWRRFTLHPPPFLGGGGGGGQFIRIILVAEPVSLGRSASNSISYNMLDKFP